MWAPLQAWRQGITETVPSPKHGSNIQMSARVQTDEEGEGTGITAGAGVTWAETVLVTEAATISSASGGSGSLL